jgi:hypothetical protein
MTWPFADPPITTVSVNADVLDRGMPVVFVTRDGDDGSWQFQTVRAPLAQRDARIVGLKTVVALDPRVAELADLPPGWCAHRDGRDGAWQRRPGRA